MKLFFLLLLITSANAFACWKMQGEFKVGEENLAINQKVNHDQKYSFQNSPYLIHITISSRDMGETARLEVFEKKGIELTSVLSEKIKIQKDRFATIKVQNRERPIYLKFKLSQI
jgi:hypothetical protein